MKDRALAADTRAWETLGAKEIREQAWAEAFQQALTVLGRKEQALAIGAKSRPWKVALAVFLKERTQVSNPWLAVRLGMNRAMDVSRLVSAVRQAKKTIPDLASLRANWTA